QAQRRDRQEVVSGHGREPSILPRGWAGATFWVGADRTARRGIRPEGHFPGRDPSDAMYSNPNGSGPSAPKKVTAPDVRARKGGPALAMVTAYDFTMARLLDEAGVELLLV